MAGLRKMQKSIQPLLEERDRLRAELAAITQRMNGEIAGLEKAISLLQRDDGDAIGDAPKTARGGAKTLLLDLLREVGTSGLNATIAEEIAKRRGEVLKRGTAASNLSRLKADGVVVHDGDRYRLPEFARQLPISAGATLIAMPRG
jgi:hypothetical protein